MRATVWINGAQINMSAQFVNGEVRIQIPAGVSGRIERVELNHEAETITEGWIEELFDYSAKTLTF